MNRLREFFMNRKQLGTAVYILIGISILLRGDRTRWICMALNVVCAAGLLRLCLLSQKMGRRLDMCLYAATILLLLVP